MPEYQFRHPKTNEVRTIFQRMLADHRYFGDDGVEWIRDFDIPQTSIDTHIDPFSKKEFLDKTKNKSATMGDLWDQSAELSEKREKKAGRDEVKEQEMQRYERKTKGKPHPGRIKKKDMYYI